MTTQPEVERCAVCGWPLAESAERGCVRGSCSMRPLPVRFYSPARVKVEYGGEHAPIELDPYDPEKDWEARATVAESRLAHLERQRDLLQAENTRVVLERQKVEAELASGRARIKAAKAVLGNMGCRVGNLREDGYERPAAEVERFMQQMKAALKQQPSVQLPTVPPNRVRRDSDL